MRKFMLMAHPVAGLLAMGTIASFLLLTLRAELSGQADTIATAKHSILLGLSVLIPALMIVGATGSRLAGRAAGLARPKMLRMRFVAANGLLVLVPSAIFLNHRAAVHQTDQVFLVVQLLEMIAGVTNLALLWRNFRDGIAMRRRRLGTQSEASSDGCPASRRS